MDGTNVVNKAGDWRGLRFENVNQMFPHMLGWTSKLVGDADTQLKYWTFKNVRIIGQLLDAALLGNPALFKTNGISDMIFEP